MRSDEEIISEVLSGEKESFSLLIDRYKSDVISISINMTGDIHLAQEIGHESFIRLYRSLDQFKGSSSLKTYVSRIAINLSLNALKRRKKNWDRQVSIDASQLKLYASEPDLEHREILHQGLMQLKPEHRAVVQLRIIDGYDVRETSEILQIEQGTVMSRLSRALKQLKNILKDLGYER